MYKLKTPQTPLALTTLGIIPFAVSAGAMLVWRDDIALQSTAGLWLIVYAATILSFLGGIRWGAEMTRRDKPRFGELAPSVVAPLIGWGLVLAYFQYTQKATVMGAMAAALTLHFILDVLTGELPLWYRRLRFWPTFGAVVSLIMAAVLLGRF